MKVIPLTETSFDAYLALATSTPGSGGFGPIPQIVAERRQEQNTRLKEIRDILLRRDHGLPLDAVSVLRKPIWIAALLGRTESEQYAIINYIRDALGQQDDDHKDLHAVAPFTDESAWKIAVSLARRATELAESTHYDVNSFSRAHAVADACKRWEQRGFRIRLSTFGPSLDTKDVSKICMRIEKTIRSLGGRNAINAILAWHISNRRIYEGSLLYGRAVDQLGQRREPSVPFHFLYNLSLKHLNSDQTSKQPKDDFVEVTQLARDLAAVLDVEAYVVYENMGVTISNLHHALVDRVFFDELFGFQQWQPTVAEHILLEWLKHLDALGIPLPLMALGGWRSFIPAILRISSPNEFVATHPCEYVSSDITTASTISLFEALAITSEKLNVSYCTPFDTAKRNAPYYPIYQTSTDVWLLPPRGILARALFERVYAILREEKHSQLERAMGTALELLAANAIAGTGHPPNILGEQYKEGSGKKSPTFEIDVASETDTDLFLLECKKKPLTNAARGGNSLSAAVDLAQGFIEPLVQMNRHERNLRECGIRFTSGKSLALGERNLVKISVTMTDHGSMQDRVFLRGLISCLFGVKLAAADRLDQRYAGKVNDSLTAFQEGVNALVKLTGTPLEKFLRRYLHSCWWLSIDQLYFLCRGSPDLGAAIAPLRSVTFGSGDLMTEISHSAKIGLLAKYPNPGS